MKDNPSQTKPEYSAFHRYWMFDPEVTFLNHGAFGACPIPILDAQYQFRQQLEQQPFHFFVREYEILLDQARQQLADFVGANSEDLVFVPNATTGINTVLRSLSFSEQDELLTTNHEYNACRNVLDFVASRTGAKIIIADIPFFITSSQQIIEAVMAKVSPRTKLVLIDHITSQTGLIFPIQEMIQKLNYLGIDTLIDGAHAPGMLALNLQEIKATYYTGNCHKWLSAPKGAAFLAVQQDKQGLIRPLTISHGANSTRRDRSRFLLEFDWTGTPDPSAYLSIPEAINFMGSLLPGGWSELIKTNHNLAVNARKLLAEKLDIPLPCPDHLIGSMAVLPLGKRWQGFSDLNQKLWKEYKIEVPIMPWDDDNQPLIRISAQIYNHLSQYEYLAEVLLN
ncbi:aminotransferase class V-fold PLP-dependent enzyme [Planktothrix mougeotii]|uniref:Aminotransferase class V-fold PLP-dependent enzyme n=1 Tax=Planktothrix mougeotii LEGE 06226 TaxID=1828728 RepID=A0ABR9UL67_9CYAN|nr:aminotransferase class V-fold PLP-dependent enzyme [Planktothrix mougeotii]MBE9146294.1 aminotransferase class V-fold PLP-dependent enzyme [Planktothrix mougeotii LEGE 06226]